MELRVCKLRPRPAREQTDAAALEHWDAFVNEFPEVASRHIFFVSQKSSYAPGEELTASYGSAYHRQYAACGFEAQPTAVAVPVDSFTAADLAHRSWPSCVPAWWNPDAQPLERPALRRLPNTLASCHGVVDFGEEEPLVELVPDDPLVVAARRHLTFPRVNLPDAASSPVDRSRDASPRRSVTPLPVASEHLSPRQRLEWHERKRLWTSAEEFPEELLVLQSRSTADVLSMARAMVDAIAEPSALLIGTGANKEERSVSPVCSEYSVDEMSDWEDCVWDSDSVGSEGGDAAECSV